MNGLDNVVFGKKKFSDILEEIYTNQQKKDRQISILISELKPLVQEIGDATIIQRIMNNSTGPNDGSFGISEEEKQQLLAELDKFKTEE